MDPLTRTRPAEVFRLIITLLVLVIIGSSCDYSTNKPGVDDQAATVLPVQGETITLTIWVIEKKDTFLPQLAEAYEQGHPHVDIAIREIPEEKYNVQVSDHLRKGPGPDIVQVRQPEWLASGLILSLETAIKAFRVPIDSFNPGAITRDCVFNSQVYCLGSFTSGMILVYNQDVFDLFGAPYLSAHEPLSIEEYHHLIIQLTQKSDKIEERIWGGEAGPYFNWMNPGTHFSPDGRIVTGFLNDEPTANAYQWLADAYQKGASITAGEADLVGQAPLARLIAGRQATAIVDSIEALPALEESGIRWGAAIVPTERKGDPKWSSNRTDGMGVTAASQNPDVAIDFLVFLANHGNLLRLERGEMPLNMKLAEQWAVGSEQRRHVFEALNHDRAYPFIPGYTETSQLLWEAWTQMTEKGTPAKEALDEITVQMQETLDQTWIIFETIQPPGQENEMLTPP